MAYPGDWDERECSPVRKPARAPSIVPSSFLADRPVSTGAAFLSLGTIFASLLAIGMTTAALFAPTKTAPATQMSADLTFKDR
jgi:hypothetical protein